MSDRTATTIFLFPRRGAALPYPKRRRPCGALVFIHVLIGTASTVRYTVGGQSGNPSFRV